MLKRVCCTLVLKVALYFLQYVLVAGAVYCTRKNF